MFTSLPGETQEYFPPPSPSLAATPANNKLSQNSSFENWTQKEEEGAKRRRAFFPRSIFAEW